MKFDIFCRVIDNYGDIGICWRLARQLHHEHGIAVRLWLDDLASLQRLCPEADTAAATQTLQGVAVWAWTEPFPSAAPAEVVIEGFGCGLPEDYLAVMAGQARPPVWINLEYLSAEPWIDGCHGMASPHPRLPLTRYFFFPGFSATSGGLLRESGLLAERERLQADPAALWQGLGLQASPPGQVSVSLFCYDNAPLADLLQAMSSGASPVRCLLPAANRLPQAAAWLGLPALVAGDRLQRGKLSLEVLPFLRQEDYDRLLWACDFNFVRGEDSFVRAQWAARPLIWQPYVQQEETHQVKLAAFLERYCQGLDAATADVVRRTHQAWNSGHAPPWAEYWARQEALRAHALSWAGQLDTAPDLASNLVIFCQNRV